MQSKKYAITIIITLLHAFGNWNNIIAKKEKRRKNYKVLAKGETTMVQLIKSNQRNLKYDCMYTDIIK